MSLIWRHINGTGVASRFSNPASKTDCLGGGIFCVLLNLKGVAEMGRGRWKSPVILLVSIGAANIGAWVYLIALNLIVLDMADGSALAVAGLYAIGPAAVLVTNGWCGSLIDRFNKRKMLIGFDISRAILIGLLPFSQSLETIFFIVFLLGIINAMFVPASMVYTSMLLIPEQRKSFNSFRSLVDSGAFLLGPALAGILFVAGTPEFALYVNAAALLFSGFLVMLLPDLERKKPNTNTESAERISWDILKTDMRLVLEFSRSNLDVARVYLVFSGLMVLATALDSMEAAFSIEVLKLKEDEYGFLVSIAGAGIIAGSIITAIFVKRLAVSFLMQIGAAGTAAGYLIYAFSSSFNGAAAGFFVLAFALAFANTGFQTFYQERIPAEILGRVSSIYGLAEALSIIMLTLAFGAAAYFFSIRLAVVIGSFGMLAIALILWWLNFQNSDVQQPNAETFLKKS